MIPENANLDQTPSGWCRCDETCLIHHLPVFLNKELLDALKVALNDLQCGNQFPANLRLIKAVIAKAEGREP